MEAISDLYRLSPIPTHQCGSKAIDGIYVSQALISHAKGWILQPGQVMHSDHRAVWIDIQADMVKMGQRDPIVCPLCCHLKCNDPRIVQHYDQVLVETLTESNVEASVEELIQAVTARTWTPLNKGQFHGIDQQLTTAKLHAEKYARKYVPAKLSGHGQKNAIQRVLYWKGVTKWTTKGKISTLVLKSQASKGQETSLVYSTGNYHWSRYNARSLAHTRTTTKSKQKDPHDNWLCQLIAAQAKAKNTTKQLLWKLLRQCEESRKIAKQVK